MGTGFDNFSRRVASTTTRRQVLGLFGRSAAAAIVASSALQMFGEGPAHAACIVQYPPQNLNNCPNKRPHPGNVRSSNGCGAANSDFKPPQSFGSASFTIPCNNHDICYETCNTPKSTCDSTFGNQLVDTCIATYSGSFLTETACIFVAGAYELAVTLFGGSAYDAGQTKDCECCFPVPMVYCGCTDTCYPTATDCFAAGCKASLSCFGKIICGPPPPGKCP